MELDAGQRDRLLLVEDLHEDARLIEISMGGFGGRYQVSIVGNLGAALAHLEQRETDLVLLDLGLPDSHGLGTLNAICVAYPQVPVVVLTGAAEEDMGLACIRAGAQDYLAKTAMTPDRLSRVIDYAISRFRETQIKVLREALQRYQTLSSDRIGTPVTGAMTGNRPVRDVSRALFAEMVSTYRELLREYMEHLVLKKEKPRVDMEVFITRLGDLGGAPRDLVDVHMAALEQVSEDIRLPRIAAYAVDSRLFVLEMMGHLVEYYRTGYRRLFPERPRS